MLFSHSPDSLRAAMNASEQFSASSAAVLRDLCGLAFIEKVSEPLAPVRHPPAHEHDRDRRYQCPPERQGKIRQQTQNRERNPKDFPLHNGILVPPAFLSTARRITKVP